ncbi:hypothetical protein K402DRAFT_420338 [Aulographum hederae CBS 113979]|uniref:Uncharacterized protein n=1 Tax=Aulographum hederae CBS 113979 TaxID=1176131 RepID=A0A6G1H3F6_9PEZI|nr:hypothetical protein K402DRAFT_420338 [Aulographum hederae CBS 113979]
MQRQTLGRREATDQADHLPGPSERGHELHQLPLERLSTTGHPVSCSVANVAETPDAAHEEVGNATADDRGTDHDPLLSSDQTANSTDSSHKDVLPTVVSAVNAVNESHSHRTRQWWHKVEKGWHNTWTPEFLCCGLAVFSLAAIAFILDKYNGQPLPSMSLGITLNTLVSFFVILLKAGAALPVSEGISQLKWWSIRQRPRRLSDMEEYDSASRGVWGSFQFLFKFEPQRVDLSLVSLRNPSSWTIFFKLLAWRSTNVTRYFAKLAAFVTVLAFFTDPLSQQIIQYDYCSQKDESFSAHLSRVHFYNATGVWSSPAASLIDPDIFVAIQTGIFSPPKQASSLVDVDCTSGNCTFPAFETLGVCHSCQDISDQIQSRRDEEYGFLNFTLADETNNTLLWVVPGRLVFTTAEITPTEDNWQQYEEDITRLITLSSQPSAFQCRLFACIKEYTSRVVQGTLSETLISTQPLGVQASADNWFYWRATNSTLRNGIREVCTTGAENRTDYVAMQKYNSSEEEVWYQKDCLWRMFMKTYRSIGSQLDALLEGLRIDINAHRQPEGSIQAYRLWQDGNLTLDSTSKFMEDIADSLTATMRRTGADGPVDYVPGEVSADSTCVYVQWPWFSFLAAFTGLALVFFALFYWTCPQGPEHRVWKSSSLAVLFCGLDEEVYKMAGAGLTRDEIFRAARRAEVRLVKDRDGKARFVG